MLKDRLKKVYISSTLMKKTVLWRIRIVIIFRNSVILNQEIIVANWVNIFKDISIFVELVIEVVLWCHEWILTWFGSMTWFASSLILKDMPNSDWKEFMGESVPDVNMMLCVTSLSGLNTTAGLRHQKLIEYSRSRKDFLLNHPPSWKVHKL